MTSLRYVLIVLTLCQVLSSAVGRAQEINLERASLLYGLGRVESLVQNAAVLDVGQVHGLKVEDSVAIFRRESRHHLPVGVLKVKQVAGDYARTYSTAQVTPQEGDLVMFVREFWQLQPSTQHRDNILKSNLVRTANSNRRSTGRSLETAMAMLDYQQQFPKWERSGTEVIGYLRGASFMNGERRSIESLLSHMAVIREFYRQGHTSLSSAGPRWEQTMSVLFGPTLTATHEAAMSVVQENDEALESDVQVGPREIRREVKLRFFDRLEEEQNFLAMLAASMLEFPPKRDHLWYIDKTRRSQFPNLHEQDLIFETLRKTVQSLREDG